METSYKQQIALLLCYLWTTKEDREEGANWTYKNMYLTIQASSARKGDTKRYRIGLLKFRRAYSQSRVSKAQEMDCLELIQGRVKENS